MSFLAWVDGKAPDMACFELKTLCEVEGIPITVKTPLNAQLVEFNTPDSFDEKWVIPKIRKILSRIAMTHLILYKIDFVKWNKIELIKSTIIEKFSSIKWKQYLNNKATYCVRVKRVGNFPPKILDALRKISPELERTIGKQIFDSTSAAVDFKEPDFKIKIVLHPSTVAWIGIVLGEAKRNMIRERTPSKRPYFHPSSMRPLLIRTMINIAGLKPGQFFCDPFSGSGGFLIEASLLGGEVIGSDLDQWTIHGSQLNLLFYNILKNITLICADARHLPFKSETFDVIASDPPYGTASAILETQGSKTSQRRQELVIGMVEEGYRVLKSSGRMVLCLPDNDLEIQKKAKKMGFALKASFEYYIHARLTRHIFCWEKSRKK